MQPTVLFVITSDPRSSPRPAEAIRIAAGVGAWRKTGVSLYLRGDAVWALSEFPDELVDEDNFVRYLPIMGQWGHPVLVQKGAVPTADLGEPPLAMEEIDDETLARVVMRADYVARF